MSDRDKKAIVVQYGARRMYALPSAFARQGELESFWTDYAVTKSSLPLRALSGFSPRLARALQLRQLPPELHDLTESSALWTLGVTRGFRQTDLTRRRRAVADAQEAAGHRMSRRAFGAATHLVSVFGEGFDVLRRARQAGLTVCVDVNIAFSTDRILARAAAQYPGWPEERVFAGPLDGLCPLRRLILETADRLLCPSAFVVEDLMQNHGVTPDRIRLVPYGVSEAWFAIQSNPQPFRVLFAGHAGLRKGLPVLAQAARLLRAAHPHCEVRVAGGLPRGRQLRDHCEDLHLLGPLSRSDLQREMAQADVFCLPSYAEGSAAVSYEALAAGVPLVTTFEAGTVVEDWISGRIVAAGDAERTAQAIAGICADRAMRARFSAAARLRAGEFGWSGYAARLREAVFGA